MLETKNLDYLGHNFILIPVSHFGNLSIFDKFLCKNCNVLVYFDGPYVLVSYYSNVLITRKTLELTLSCNDTIIKNIIE